MILRHTTSRFLTTLRCEHDTISDVLEAVATVVARDERLGVLSRSFYQRALVFYSEFVDRRHQEKEEKHLFAVLRPYVTWKEAAPIERLLDDRRMARRCIVNMRAALKDAGSGTVAARHAVRIEALRYARLLNDHIQREERVLFPLAERVLPPEVMADLEKRFRAAHDTAGFPEARDKYAAMARELVLLSAMEHGWDLRRFKSAGAHLGDRMRRHPPAVLEAGNGSTVDEAVTAVPPWKGGAS